MRTINVGKLGLKELEALNEKLSVAIVQAREREKSHVKKKVAELVDQHGFSVAELFGGKTAKGGRLRAAKYVNPDNPAFTWTGRGRRPKWLLNYLKKGAKLSDFEI